MKDITKKNVEDFVEIRNSGVCNMLSSEVRDTIGIDKDQHWYICQHFDELCEKFGIDPDEEVE